MEVEWIILADAAEVINNKLYLIGGGWDSLTMNSPLPLHYPCAIAVSFKVPWNETNQRHAIEIVIADQDGAQLAVVEGQIEVGRPPGIPLGQAQRVQMAMRMMLPLTQLGTNVIIVRIEGVDARKIEFNVVAGPNFNPLAA